MTQPPSPLTLLLSRHTRRREFITLLGGAAAAWPLAARGERVPVIGVLGPGTADEERHRLDAFKRGLGQAGYVESQSVSFEYRWAQGRFDRLPAMAADLVRSGVAVIAILGGTITVLAAKAATATIPILFVTGGDPVKAGLVASLNRPGGNITGISMLSGALDSKRVEALHEVLPKVVELAILRNPNNPNARPETDEAQTAARSKGLRLRVFDASTADEIDTAYAALVRDRLRALVVGTDPFLNTRVEQLVALARFSATVVACAVQTEEAAKKGETTNDNQRPEHYP